MKPPKRSPRQLSTTSWIAPGNVRPADLKKALSAHPPTGVYLLTASSADAFDLFLADGCTTQLIEAALPPQERSDNVSRYDGDELDLGSFLDACQTVTMFGSGSVVVLHRAEALLADAQEALLETIPRLPDTTVLVLRASKLDGRQRFTKTLMSLATVVEVDTPADPGELARWAVQKCRAAGKTLDERLGREMAVKAGGLASLMQLVEQVLMLTGDDTTIRRESAAALWRVEPQENVFAITDALAARDSTAALRAAADAERSGAHYLQLLALIESAVRRLIGVREGLDAGLSNDAIADRLGIKKGAVYHQREKAAAWSTEALRALHRDVLALEYNTRAGGGDPRLRLESFLVSACR